MDKAKFETVMAHAVKESIISGAACIAGRKDGKVAPLCFVSMTTADLPTLRRRLAR